MACTIAARALTPAAASGRFERAPTLSARTSRFAARARFVRSSNKVVRRAADFSLTKATSWYIDEPEPREKKDVDELQVNRFGNEYKAESWPKWEELKTNSMVAPSSRQRKSMGRKLKKMGAREVMSAYDWEKLTFMRDGWELRTVEPRVAVPRKTTDKEIRSWESYKRLKEELVADTSVISGFVLVCLCLLGLEVNTTASFAIGAGFAVLYVRLLAAEVDNVKSGDQVIAEVGTNAQWDPLKLAAPLRMTLPVLLIFISINFELAMSNYGFDEGFAGVDAIHLMPALGGFAMYKIAVVYQATRVAINEGVKRSLKQEEIIESGDYLK